MCDLFASNLRTEQIVFIVSSETQLGGTFICLGLELLARYESAARSMVRGQSLRSLRQASPVAANEPDDDPPEFVVPTRLLDPQQHTWPKLEK